MKKQEWKPAKKQEWRAGNMLYPLPAVLVSAADGKGRDNLITIAWARNGLYQSSHGVSLCAAGAVFVCDAEGDGRIRDQPYYGRFGFCHRLLRCALRQR